MTFSKFLGLPLFLSFLMALSGVSNAQSTLYIHQNGVVQTHSNSSVALFGSLNNDGTFGGTSNANQGSLYFSGTVLQTILGDSIVHADSIHINNSSNVQLNLELRVGSHAWFDNGIFLTNRADSNTIFLHFLDDASHSGSNNSSFVDGVVRKTGDDAFRFPIGAGSNIQQIAISAPGSNADHFTAFYKAQNGSNQGMSTTAIDSQCGGSPVMVDISEKEFWHLLRTKGSSNVQVNLSYDTYSGVSAPAQVMVARWNGSEWESHGNGGNTGSASDGSITSGNGCGSAGSPVALNDFGYFSLGATSLSALPVELLDFTASWMGGTKVELNWVTAHEFNNSHFIIQRRTANGQFESIGRVNGQGSSNQIHRYTFTDEEAQTGPNYYRLKQVDFDNTYAYSPVRKVRIELHFTDLVVYPNPTKDYLNIRFGSDDLLPEATMLELYDSRGSKVYSKPIEPSSDLLKINISGLPRGIYTLQVGYSTQRIIKH